MISVITFLDYLNDIKPEINARIEEATHKLNDSDIIPLLLRGKRLRAGITILVFDAMSNKESDRRKAIDLACAIELAHSASLIVDDMLDQDTRRRGQPAVHLTKGHKQAMLDSIGVLSLPYDLMAKYGCEYIEMLADTQRTMVSGVIRELIKKPDLPALKLYDLIISQKTGRLFRLAAQYGSMAAGLDPAQQVIIADYGLYCGKTMQIADDMTDLQKIIEGKKVGVFGSEMLLLKCMTADRLLKEFVTDVKKLSLKPKKIKELWTRYGVGKSLDNMLLNEINEAQKCIESISIPYIGCEELLLNAPVEIADIMLKEE